METMEREQTREIYLYGNKTFMPVGKLCKSYDDCSLSLSTDYDLCFWTKVFKGLRNYGEPLVDYSKESFYDAMYNSSAEIFFCMETGKLYIPGLYELFVFNGYLNNNSLDNID